MIKNYEKNPLAYMSSQYGKPTPAKELPSSEKKKATPRPKLDLSESIIIDEFENRVRLSKISSGSKIHRKKKSDVQEKPSVLMQIDSKKPNVQTLHINKNYKVPSGAGLFVMGNIKELGNNDTSKAVKLQWNEGDNWTADIEVTSVTAEQWDGGFEVEYNYFENADNGPENVGNVKMITERVKYWGTRFQKVLLPKIQKFGGFK